MNAKPILVKDRSQQASITKDKQQSREKNNYKRDQGTSWNWQGLSVVVTRADQGRRGESGTEAVQVGAVAVQLESESLFHRVQVGDAVAVHDGFWNPSGNKSGIDEIGSESRNRLIPLQELHRNLGFTNCLLSLLILSDSPSGLSVPSRRRQRIPRLE
ncbi:hypothetical protein U1Q18_019768 [Sarracenia purpurea var. burkii]